MMKKLMSALLMITSIQCSTQDEKTIALHNEIVSHNAPYITKDKNPLLYYLIEKLCAKAQISMPRYIALFSTAFTQIGKDGIAYTKNQEITAYVDFIGDMYICRELLSDLSYKEIKGILAVVIADSKENRPAQLALAGVGTTALSTTGLLVLNNKYKLGIGEYIMNQPSHRDRKDALCCLLGMMVTPSLLVTSIISCNLQKKVDLKATQLTKTENVINGIVGLERIKDSYYKENIFSRIAHQLRLQSLVNNLFYFVRPYTWQERVEYLQEQK